MLAYKAGQITEGDHAEYRFPQKQFHRHGPGSLRFSVFLNKSTKIMSVAHMLLRRRIVTAAEPQFRAPLCRTIRVLGPSHSWSYRRQEAAADDHSVVTPTRCVKVCVKMTA